MPAKFLNGTNIILHFAVFGRIFKQASAERTVSVLTIVTEYGKHRWSAAGI